ncbi:hypothetical protein FHX42_005119 [Saccharopolyspora lacisalsi]|uniref:Glycoprotein n=1 Tax=Halosaccharopolyspora lacisalsi TaxID=1000566 RepID=A0A839E1L0_9PSEU|nr:DUF6049 family protein [Halosaccharopolyspora lacisalsi]MBA8827714.1 hypothetical protein [Halosaccharopolyspora lacisalsi]
MRFLLFVAVTVLLLGLAPPMTPEASAQSGRPLAHLEVTKVTPSVVRADSPPEVTVTGTLTNASERVINDLEIRLQRGAPRATEASVQQAMRSEAPTSTLTPFADIGDRIKPGQRVPFTLRVPLAGGSESLGLTRTGVYPLLLNVNGEPAYGNRARVAESRFMLPVTTLPGAPPTTPAKATPTTMLVPLVGYPRMRQEQTPGSPGVLVDDRLAESLAPGGRLYGLVHAVNQQAGSGSPLNDGLCFAVDPDLLATATTMLGGYRVRQDDGSTRAGTGAESAKLWLDELKKATRDRCVIALPYADSDIVAFGRAGLPDLIRGALDGSRIVRRTLGVKPRTDVLWPIDGALDEPAATQLAGMGITTALMHPDALARPESSLRPARIRTGAEDYAPTAQPTDPLLANALDPGRRSAGTSAQLSPRGDGTPSVQNTLGALTFRATQGFEGGARSVLAPPRRWNLDGEELSSLLRGMKRLTKAGYVRPTSIPHSDAQSSDAAQSSGGTASQGDEKPPPEVALNYPVDSATEEIRQPVLDKLAARNYKVGDLYRSSEKEPAVNVDPAQVTTPLRNGLLRGASSAWRGDPAASREWVDKADDAIESVLSQVQVDKFAGDITLANSNSPIPITVRNQLPITVGVNLNVSGPPGIEVEDLGLLKIPAKGSRNFYLQTDVRRAGKFSVDVALRAAYGGTQLGQARRLQLNSNAYGAIPLIITGSAAALLVLLSARRIVGRFRRASANKANPPPESTPETTTERDRDPDWHPDQGHPHG